jgi:hypothetical protein
VVFDCAVAESRAVVKPVSQFEHVVFIVPWLKATTF